MTRGRATHTMKTTVKGDPRTIRGMNGSGRNTLPTVAWKSTKVGASASHTATAHLSLGIDSIRADSVCSSCILDLMSRLASRHPVVDIGGGRATRKGCIKRGVASTRNWPDPGCEPWRVDTGWDTTGRGRHVGMATYNALWGAATAILYLAVIAPDPGALAPVRPRGFPDWTTPEMRARLACGPALAAEILRAAGIRLSL